LPVRLWAILAADDHPVRILSGDVLDSLAGHAVDFRPQRLDMIREVENWHFWHEPRRRLLLDIIRKQAKAGAKLLDVGCGTGLFCEILQQAGYKAFGADPWADRFGLDETWFRTASTDQLPWSNEEFDIACALDVLEHVDDEQALSEIFRVVRPSGTLVVCVPAHGWLWSERDVLAGHRRRYDRGALRDLLYGAGFATERIFGFQFALLPLLIVSRFWQRWRGKTNQVEREDRPGTFVNAVLREVNRAEVKLGRFIRPPFGSSLIAVAHKPHYKE
jgi:SAM-dependent methyltransferase